MSVEAALRTLPIPEGLPLPGDFTPNSEHTSHLGNVVITRATAGTYLSQLDIVRALSEHDALEDGMADKIHDVGFMGGSYLHSDTEARDPELQTLRGKNAGTLLRRVAHEREWDHAHVVFCSTTMGPEARHIAQKELESQGVDIESVEEVDTACSSGTIGLARTLFNPELDRENVLLYAGDYCSGDRTDITTPVTYSVFSNGEVAMGYRPGSEILGLNGMIVVKPAPADSFTLPEGGNFDLSGEHVGVAALCTDPTAPFYYELYEGAPDRMVVTRNGFKTIFHEEGTGRMNMNGIAMMQDFASGKRGEEWPPARVVTNTAAVYSANSAEQYGPVDAVSFHHASKTVVTRLQREVQIQELTNAGLDRKHALRLAKLPPEARIEYCTANDIDERIQTVVANVTTLPWTIDRIPVKNCSSGTQPSVLEDQVARGEIQPDMSVQFVGMGIGLSLVSHVARIRSHKEMEAANSTTVFTFSEPRT